MATSITDLNLINCSCSLASSVLIINAPRFASLRSAQENECPKRICKCENRYRGCEQTMTFDSLHSHETHRCMYRRDECRLCFRSMLHHQRDEHEADLCPLRMVSCDVPVGLGCEEVLKAQDMRDHVKNHCALRLVQCHVSCGQSFPQRELEYHEKQICVQLCMWEGCGRGEYTALTLLLITLTLHSVELGPEDVRVLHEKFLCPRRVVKCPNCPIAGLVSEVSLNEDEHTRDESLEMATDIMATSTTKLTHSIRLAPSSLGAAIGHAHAAHVQQTTGERPVRPRPSASRRAPRLRGTRARELR